MTGVSLIGYLVYLAGAVAQSQPGEYSALGRAAILKACHLAARKALAEVADAGDRERSEHGVIRIGLLAATALEAVPLDALVQAMVHGAQTDNQIADLVMLFA